MEVQRFTDKQMTEACGLHQDNLRRLITWKAVTPIQAGGGRGKIRLWNFDHVRRISSIALLFNAGFSLRLAHTIAYCLPFEEILLPILQPDVMAQNRSDIDGWYDPVKLRVELDEQDCFVDVINRRFLFFGMTEITDNDCFGYISDDQTMFFGRYNIRTHYSFHTDDPEKATTHAKWERNWIVDRIDPASLAFEYDPDFDEATAKDTFSRPLVKMSINVTLGMRIAFRKIMGLPVDYP
jgi:DNA-binding transcriptional MerR regulator